jgi:multidrug efflux pump subunit AcrA (membrane-fusion protein)
MTAEVEFLIAQLDDVLTVPITALATVGRDQAYVAVKQPDGAFEWRAVTVGMTNDQTAEIKDGLRNGEIIAVRPKDPSFPGPPVSR